MIPPTRTIIKSLHNREPPGGRGVTEATVSATVSITASAFNVRGEFENAAPDLLRIIPFEAAAAI